MHVYLSVMYLHGLVCKGSLAIAVWDHSISAPVFYIDNRLNLNTVHKLFSIDKLSQLFVYQNHIYYISFMSSFFFNLKFSLGRIYLVYPFDLLNPINLDF